jgi:asparagine synthase (glutamine-hydrolysing)
MCGIGGIVNFEDSAEKLTDKLLEMQSCIAHRGPDDRGLYVDQRHPTGLCHTRLSILDLTSAGHQPMSSPDSRYHLTFNGEIYNFRELREELSASGEEFRTQTDSEVLLRAYARYGETFVQELKGMFALAIWDSHEQRCVLARDPLGIKPLYYAQHGSRLAFASEVRAIVAANLSRKRIDQRSLFNYLLFGSVQEPDTLLDDVRALPAGHLMVFQNGKLRIRQYWDMQFGTATPNSADSREIVKSAMKESVSRHLVSDVPVSIFLSGGIDSTTLLALAAKQSLTKLKTFCISFDEEEFNEGDLAAKIARHFGAEHADLRLRADEGSRLLPKFLEAMDQPSVDGFNTYCVAKHARESGAKVVLSGLGGDELFGGYPSFRTVPRLVHWNRALLLTGPLKRAVALAGMRAARSPRWRRLSVFMATLPGSALAYWCQRGIFTPFEATLLAKHLCGDSSWTEPMQSFDATLSPQPTLQDEVSYLELTRYMRNQLLRDSDVMSMVWGLELRVPFVDRTLLEKVGVLAGSIRLAPHKRALVDAIPEVPRWVSQQPKRGFRFPFDFWMRDQWHETFAKLDSTSPVRLESWYRRWCLFVLTDYVQRLGISLN